MKSLKNCFWGVFLVLAITGQPLHGVQGEGSTVEAVVESVDQKISLLDQIIHHATNIVDFPNRGNRSRSKKELTKLMNNKELDAKIKDAIKSDIEIIKNGKTTYAVNAAFQRLLATYNKINAQANVVDTIAKATEMVKNASPEELEETIAQAGKKVEEAQEEEQGIMGRWYSKAKRMVTKPVNYVFGEESSYAKTAFYAAVGAAILAAGTYAAYQYGVGSSADNLPGAVPGLSFNIPRDDKELLKDTFINRLNVLSNIQDYKYGRNKSIFKQTENDVKILERELSSFMTKENIEVLKNEVLKNKVLNK
jgi:hypothetical protein